MAVGPLSALDLFVGVAAMLGGMMLAAMYWCPWTTPLNGRHLFSVVAAGGYSLVAGVLIAMIISR